MTSSLTWLAIRRHSGELSEAPGADFGAIDGDIVQVGAWLSYVTSDQLGAAQSLRHVVNGGRWH